MSSPKRPSDKPELEAFTLPGEAKAIRCDGEVVNVPDKQGYGMGIRFLDLASGDTKLIESFAKETVESSTSRPTNGRRARGVSGHPRHRLTSPETATLARPTARFDLRTSTSVSGGASRFAG